MNEQQTGRAWIEINKTALHQNVLSLQSRLPSGCRLMPAVKANAYGHGAVEISKELSRMGIDTFCVASVEEGVELREAGIKGEILVLGYTAPFQFPLLHNYHLTQTILSSSYADTMNDAGEHLNGHIKVDTGMHRLGESAEQLTHFNVIFDEISRNRQQEMIAQKDKALSGMSTFPLIGAGMITVALTISILTILGDLINVI